MNPWDQFSGANAGYVYELFERYQRDPSSVDEATRRAFATWTPRGTRDHPRHLACDPQAPASPASFRPASPPSISPSRFAASDIWPRELDPLGFHDPIGDPSLAPQSHGLTTDTLKQLPASIVSGPAAAGAANAFEAIAKAAADLLFDHRPRLQPRVRAGRARVAAAGGRVGAVPPAQRSDRRQRAARPHHAGRDVRAVPASDVPRQDALFDRGPRHDGPDPRRDRARRRRRRRAARDDRDGASRPPERARAHPAEAVLADPRGVQGSDPRQPPARRSRLDGRREVPRRRARRSAARRPAQAGHHLDAAEPEPPRSGGSGAERHGARRRHVGGGARRADRRQGQGARDPDSRRCGVPGPGRRRRDAESLAARRLRRRRHHSHHRQQPARFHDRSRRVVQHQLRERPRARIQDSDHARQRRRSGRVHRGGAPGDRLSPALQARLPDRPRRLSQVRPQRRR